MNTHVNANKSTYQFMKTYSNKKVILFSDCFTGVLNPLDTPHHMKVDDNVPYREGVVLDRPVKKGCGSFVNVGMRKEVRIDKSLKPGIRVTVKMGDTSGIRSYSHTTSTQL